MTRCFWRLLLLAGFVVFGPLPGGAAVEKNVLTTFTIPGVPLDTTVSGDGNLFFVLTDAGKIYIYEKGAVLKDTLDVGGFPDMVNASPDGNLLYLTDKESGAVQIVSVDFVQKIETEGNSFKGAMEAPVVLAIFSDFQ